MPTRSTPPPRWRRLIGTALLWLAAVAPAQAGDIKLAGAGTAASTMRVLAEAYNKLHPQTRIHVLPAVGSQGGIKAVLAGAVDIGLSARALTDAEARAGATAIEYGRTPLVMAVAPSTPVAGLTLAELVDIYAGITLAWRDGAKLRLVLRPAADSDTRALAELSPAMRQAVEGADQRPGLVIAMNDQEAADLIERVPGAIGPTSLAQILAERRALKALALNGVAPTAHAIADGSYPLYKAMRLVTGPKQADEARSFIAFVQSAAGRALLTQTGYWIK